MKPSRIPGRAGAIAGLWLAFVAGSLTAQAVAQEPLRLVTGAQKGDTADEVLRLVAEQLALRLEQQVVVQNRGGAAGRIAIDAVAGAVPDGRTLLFTDTSLITHPLVTGDETATTTEHFAPVALVARQDLVLAVPTVSELQSVQELVDLARSAPDALIYASPGVGSLPHLAMVRLSQAAGATTLHVPYIDEARAATDIVSGIVDVGVGGLAALQPHLEADRVRLLGRFSAEGDSLVNGVPAVAEVLPTVDVARTWFLVAPAGSPQAELEPVAQALHEVLQLPAVQNGMAARYFWPAWGDSAALVNWVQAEYDLWFDVIDSAQIGIP